MGSDVTLVEYNEHLLARLDRDAGTLLAERFEEDGIRVLVEAHAERVEATDAGIRAAARSPARCWTPSGCSSRPVDGRASTGSDWSTSASRSRSGA